MTINSLSEHTGIWDAITFLDQWFAAYGMAIEPSPLVSATVDECADALMHRIVRWAAEGRASNVHLEPRAQMLQVRLRVGGLLGDLCALDRNAGVALTTAFLRRVGLEESDRRLPHLAEFPWTDGIAARLSVLPTQYGQTVVIRSPYSQATFVASLPELGMDANVTDAIYHWILRDNGLIVVYGSTGNGKTTLCRSLVDMVASTRSVDVVHDAFDPQFSSGYVTKVEAGTRLSELPQQPDARVLVLDYRVPYSDLRGIVDAARDRLVVLSIHGASFPGTIRRISAVAELDNLPGVLIGGIGCAVADLACTECRAYDGVPSDYQLARIIKTAEDFQVALPEPLILSRANGVCPRCHGYGVDGRTGLYEATVNAGVNCGDSATAKVEGVGVVGAVVGSPLRKTALERLLSGSLLPASAIRIM